MATDFKFSLENTPGTGARVLEAVAQAGVNVSGLCAVSGGQVVHLTVEDGDADRARQALQSAGVQNAEERQVLISQAEDRPGSGAAIFRRLADAGINIEYAYLATNTRIVLGVDDPRKAQSAL